MEVVVPSEAGSTDSSPPEPLGASPWLAAPSRRELRVLLPGGYAWGATVAAVAFSSGSAGAQLAALLALAALLVGARLARFHPRAGRMVGVVAFLALCLTAWGLSARELAAPRLDPTRAALGGLGWVLFVFGWGRVGERPGGTDPEPPLPDGPVASIRISRVARLAVAPVIAAAVGLPLLAWRASGTSGSLLAHCAAIAGGMALVVVGIPAVLALVAGGRRVRLRSAWWGVLALWLLLGLSLQQLGQGGP